MGESWSSAVTPCLQLFYQLCVSLCIAGSGASVAREKEVGWLEKRRIEGKEAREREDEDEDDAAVRAGG